MANFKVIPHPSEAQVLQGQNLARTLYTIGVDAEGGGGGGDLPVFLGVVMDKSGSMEGPKIYAAKEALLKLLERVPPTDDVVVHISLFSSDAFELSAPMTGRQLAGEMQDVTRRIKNIRADGATSMGRGLRVAKHAAGYYPNFERRVLLISDGMQQGDEPIESVYEASRELSEMGARIDAWGVGNDWDADELRTIAHTTGGEADVIPDAAGLADAVAELFEEVQTTKAGNVRLLLQTPKGTTIRSVRQVFPSVQDRAARQLDEQRWEVPVGSLSKEEPKFVVEIETTPRGTNVPFRILVPTVMYSVGGQDQVDELDRSSWFFVKWVGTPGEVQMDEELTRFTGEEEIASLSKEGFALLDMGAVEQATAKLSAALQKAIQINSPQAQVLSSVVNQKTGKLVSTNAGAAVNKTGKLHTGKTGKLLAGTGKLPKGGG